MVNTPATVQFHNFIDGVCTECYEGALIGDVNSDGEISNSDVLMIYRYIFNSSMYPMNVKTGDVNKDGYVSNADVLLIYRYIFNPTLYPIN